VKLDSELGVVESEDVEEALQARMSEIRGCYARAGDAQRYAEGRVVLRFLVTPQGRTRDVWVVDSSLGSYDVERCLVAIGRQIRFPAPGGRDGTTFDYPIAFRSTEQVPVLDIDGLKVEQDLTAALPTLGACGQLAASPVSAILYIEPDGAPGSVGLSVPAALDEKVAECMVESIKKWRMSAKLPAHVMRTTFTIPPVIATAEVTPRHPARKKSRRR